MEVSLLWEHGKSQQYNLTNRGKMKKKRKGSNTRQGIYAQEHYIGVQIRRETKEVLDGYCREQYELTGVRLRKLDVMDIAIKAMIENKNLFQFAIDFKNKKK